MAEYYVVRDKNTGLYFRGKGVNRWGKHYNQASIYRIKANAENTIKEVSWRGEQAEIVPIQIIETTADVVPKSEEGVDCPTCHGTGRIGTTDWLTKNISKKQLAEEKAKAIAEHEQHIKTEVAREIFAEVEKILSKNRERYSVGGYHYDHYKAANVTESIAELKKKYIGE